MTMDRHSKFQRIGLLRQPKAAGTATAVLGAGANDSQSENVQGASANYYRMNYNIASVIPNPNVTNQGFNWVNGNSVFMDENRDYTESAGVLPTLDFSGTAMVKNISAHLSAALLGVSESATTPYRKSFTPADTVLDFFADTTGDGYLYTIAGDALSGSGDGFLLKNAILNTYTLSFNNTGSGNERLATESGQWIGNELNLEQTLSGSFSSILTTGFLNNNASTADAFILNLTSANMGALTNVCWRNFTLTINNNVTSDCYSYGLAKSYKRTPEINITIDIPYNSDTYYALSDFKEGNYFDVEFKNTKGVSVLGDFAINSNYSVLTTNPYVYEGDYIAIRLELAVKKPSAGWAALVELNDEIDWAF